MRRSRIFSKSPIIDVVGLSPDPHLGAQDAVAASTSAITEGQAIGSASNTQVYAGIIGRFFGDDVPGHRSGLSASRLVVGNRADRYHPYGHPERRARDYDIGLNDPLRPRDIRSPPAYRELQMDPELEPLLEEYTRKYIRKKFANKNMQEAFEYAKFQLSDAGYKRKYNTPFKSEEFFHQAGFETSILVAILTHGNLNNTVHSELLSRSKENLMNHFNIYSGKLAPIFNIFDL